MSTTPEAPHVHAAEHETIYHRLSATDDFRQLRKRYRGFAIPWTVAFLVWYLLFVVMCMWAPGFMDAKVLGHINVALVFGLLQFVSTFLIAWLYSRYSTAKLDPLARSLNDEYEKGAAR